jgi:beta-galactosidase beta subunit/5-hydroxyisourate hydrolase-like protein (transthyretin family)
MNPTKILFSVFALIFTISTISALYIPETFDPCLMYGICFEEESEPNITVSLEQTTFYVESDKTLDLYFIVKNTGDKAGNIIIQMQPEDDEEDYFTAERVSKELEILPNSEERIKYRIYIEDNADYDKYKLPFKIIEYYYKNGDYVQDSYFLYANIYVEEFDLIDVYLENNEICVNYDAPQYTNLIFENDSSRTYYISPKIRSDLMISVKSDLIEVRRDREVKVELKINKELPLGEYDLVIKQDIYEDTVYTNPKYIEKTLTLEVVDCVEENLFVYMPTKTLTMDSDDTKQVSLSVTNSTGEEMPVYFEYKTSDPSITVTFPNKYLSLKDNTNKQNNFKIITSNTSSGSKTVTIIVETPYTTIEKDITVNVTKDNLEISSNYIDIPLGLKGTQDITLTNNTNNNMSLYLAIKPNYTDILLLQTNNLTLSAGQSKTVKVEITPKTIGSKEYTFVIAGSVNKEYTLNYTSNSEVSNINFVSNYETKTNPKVNFWNNLKVTLYNPHNFTTMVSLKVLGNDIETKTLNIQLNPYQTRSVDLGYMPGASASKANLEVSSNLGSNTYPITMNLIYDTENPKALEIKEVPTTLGYLKEKTTKETFKVYNPNNFSVNGTLKIIDNNNLIIAEKTFSISPNSETDVDVEYKINTNTSGIIKLIAGNSVKDYNVIFTEKTGFFETGLFGLGLGNTLSIIIGAIIIVGLLVYFIVRRY